MVCSKDLIFAERETGVRTRFRVQLEPRSAMKFGRGQKDSVSTHLFQNVVYGFHETLCSSKRIKLAALLEKNGAVPGSVVDDPERNGNQNPKATHIIADHGLQEAGDDSDEPSYLVTPQWVEAAVRNGFVHHPKYYSTHPSKIFSGVVVALDQIEEDLAAMISKEVHEHGGQFRSTLDEDVTHLVTAEARGNVYRKASEKNIKIVLPEWVDTCIKLRRLVKQEPYLLLTTSSKSSKGKANPVEQLRPRNSLNDLIYPYPNKGLTDVPEPQKAFLSGYRFYFGPDINITHEASLCRLKELVIKAGATVEDSYCDKVNIVVAKHRSSHFYIKACREGKMVATVWWVSNTLARGRFVPPTQTLLDYPTPRGGIPGMNEMLITTSGYKTIERDYIQRLAIHCGVSVSPKLTKKTTHLISATCTSPKYIQAKKWNIPIINHLWLEECYQMWDNKPVSDACYTYQPGEAILRDLVGKTPVNPDVAEKWYKDLDHQPMEIPRKYIESLQQTDENSSDSSSLSRTPRSAVLTATNSSVTYVRRARKAALDAKNALHDIVVPDMNAYQKERKLLQRQRSDDDNVHKDSRPPKIPRR